MKRKPVRQGRYLAVDLWHVDLVRGGRRVLRDLRWRIRPGQRWVLQGANGAGKTQLLKLIAGDVWPQPHARTRRLYRWHGELSAEPYGVKDEIAYLGAERQDRYQHYDWNHRVSTIVGTGIQRSDAPLRVLNGAERARVARVLRRLGIEVLAQRRFLTLSQGERRLVLLARALTWRPALLLLDEPLNGLDATHRDRVLAALGTLRRWQLPWICALHRLEEVPAGVTHWARLERGRLRTARWSARAPHLPGVRRPRASHPEGNQESAVLMAARHATVWRAGRAVLRRVSMVIRCGECWIVHGANGSGKSTWLATLHGEHGVARGGAIWREQHEPGTPLLDFQRHVGYVAPELQAALPRHLTALESIVAGLRGAYELDGALTPSERRVAHAALRELGALGLARRGLGELSYGQARRVLFARALARQPDIVLLDEPYTGLDAPTRRRLRALVERWVGNGRTVVMASHHRDDWPQRATHELELDGGEVRYSGPLRDQARGRRVPRP